MYKSLLECKKHKYMKSTYVANETCYNLSDLWLKSLTHKGYAEENFQLRKQKNKIIWLKFANEAKI